MKVILITGAAGFIGSNLAKRILCEEQDVQVIGIDSMTDYYDVNLKKDRLQELGKFGNFIFVKGDIADKATIQEVFSEYRPEVVVNLAAQAGVRYSIDNPDVYIASNLIGF